MSQPSARSSAAPAAPVPKARIFIEFPDGAPSFVDVLATTNPPPPAGTRLTPTVFELEAEIPGVIAQDTATGRLIVMDKVRLEFQLATGFGFRPVGVTFKQIPTSATAPNDSNGRDNFPRSSVKIQDDPRQFPTIEISNIFKRKGLRWKIFIVIQDDRGNLGVVDPEIENSDITLTPGGRGREGKK